MTKRLTDAEWIKQNSGFDLEERSLKGLCWQCGGKGKLWWVFGGRRGAARCDVCSGDGKARSQ